MGEPTTLTDEEIKTTWTKAGTSTGPEASADPDTKDSDGTDGDSGADSDGTDGDSDGTDGDSGTDSDGTDS